MYHAVLYMPHMVMVVKHAVCTSIMYVLYDDVELTRTICVSHLLMWLLYGYMVNEKVVLLSYDKSRINRWELFRFFQTNTPAFSTDRLDQCGAPFYSYWCRQTHNRGKISIFLLYVHFWYFQELVMDTAFKEYYSSFAALRCDRKEHPLLNIKYTCKLFSGVSIHIYW